MKVVLVLTAILAVFVLILFIFIVFPILSIVNLLSNDKLSTRGKVGWLVFSVFVWPLGASLYSAINPKGKFYFFTGVFASLVSTAALAGVVWINVTAKESALQNLARFSVTTAGYEASVIDSDKNKFSQNISILREEIQGAGWYRLDVIWDRYQLSELLKKYSKDNVITSVELSDWNGKFLSREVLDSEKFERYVRKK